MKLSVATFLIRSASAFVPVAFKPTAFKSFPSAVRMSDNAGPPQSGNVPGSPVTYTINVDNAKPVPIEVCIFKSPAKFSGVDGTYVNSLASKIIQPNGTSQCTFTISTRYLAAALNYNGDQAGNVMANCISLQPMTFGQVTDMKVDENNDPYLEPQRPRFVDENAIPGGAFAINTSNFFMFEANNPEFHIGLGAVSNGVESITSFTKALPGMWVDVFPVVKFYVAIRGVERNSVVDFTNVSATAAECDATGGKRNFKVTRTNTGTWQVTGK